ncbi:MAG: NADH-quinone oxidoreductase subunit N [Planctomycetaceae bacterium]|nr:NADH-quinone oxidoreductase subunit N [Planctomycetota bacterium]NUN51282.1 NADH-quinone oxidoreductase subunit N [Planctomycetaceae bacterium]
MDIAGPFAPVLLETLSACGAGAVLLVDLFTPEARKSRVGAASLAVTAILFLAAWFGMEAGGETATLFGGSLVLDGMAVFLKRTFATAGLLAVLAAIRYEDRLPRGRGEFHFLLLSALTGMFLVSSVGDLMSMFVSLELVTLSFFILAAFRRERPESVEAGLKLLVLGSLAAAFVLFGTAFLYGATGDLTFAGLRDHLASLRGAPPSRDLLLGLLFVLLGLGFKIGMVPMQVWVPDVYQGAPAPVTAFLAVGSKAAGFALVLRLVTTVAGPGTKDSLQLLFTALAFATLFYGNLAAIPQTNVKRLLGYSSIGHCGYLLMGLAALGPASYYDESAAASGAAAILFYLLAYALTTFGAFLVVILFSAATGSDEMDDYAGLSRRSPLLAASLTVALLSLAGVPPLAGFFGKFMLMRSVALTGPAGFGLLVAGAVNVVIGLYYYLCLVKRMYVHPPKDASPLPVTGPTAALLYALTAALLILGIFPGAFVTLASDAARAAFGVGG